MAPTSDTIRSLLHRLPDVLCTGSVMQRDVSMVSAFPNIHEWPHTEICQCGGSGTVPHPLRALLVVFEAKCDHGSEEWYRYTHSLEGCQRCGGTGFIAREYREPAEIRGVLEDALEAAGYHAAYPIAGEEYWECLIDQEWENEEWRSRAPTHTEALLAATEALVRKELGDA